MPGPEEFANRIPEEVLDVAWKINEVHDDYVTGRNKYDELGEKNTGDALADRKRRNFQGIVLWGVREHYVVLLGDIGRLLSDHELLPVDNELRR